MEISAKSHPDYSKPIVILVLIAVLLWMAWHMWGSEVWAKGEAERAIASKLVEPHAARFREVHVVRTPAGLVVCGWVNGRRFWVDPPRSSIHPMPNDPQFEHIVWPTHVQTCKW